MMAHETYEEYLCALSYVEGQSGVDPEVARPSGAVLRWLSLALSIGASASIKLL